MARHPRYHDGMMFLNAASPSPARPRWRRAPLLGRSPGLLLAGLLLGALLPWGTPAWAGAQREEPLSASVRSLLARSVADSATDRTGLPDPASERTWLMRTAERLAGRIPDLRQRLDLLRTVHYEATRAGLEPELVLAVIQVESGFHKYAVSPVGARGYMQVMPFWLREIGGAGQDLFHLRTNLRFGCTILRYYVDSEHGDLFRALGRYNGSLGQPQYPNLVLAAWRREWASAGLASAGASTRLR